MLPTWQKLKYHPEGFKKYFIREQVTALIRIYFTGRGFHEVEVPLLTPKLPAESYVEVFETKLLDRARRSQRAFLTTSPEIFLKKLLVAGIGDCFTICKSFRNSETSANLHNPEFTILEWYEVGKDYTQLIKTTQELIIYIYKLLKLPKLFKYQNQQIDLTPPWPKITMSQAFKKYAQIDLEKALDLPSMQKLATTKGYQIEKQNTWEELFNQIYLNEVAPHLGKGKPTFIYDYPAQLAAFAKIKEADPKFAERVELYIGGLEIGDGCSELTNWQELEKRFKTQTSERKRLGKTGYPDDEEFIQAHKMGLPQCAGLALGVDRLLMLLTNSSQIQDTLLFPADQMWRD